MRRIIIANPKAAAGKVGRRWQQYQRAIFAHMGTGDVHLTNYRGHATLLVQRAVEEGAEQIVIVGGDGTLGEAVNGLSDKTTGALLSALPSLVYVPGGTGGDFARSLGQREKSFQEMLTRCSPRKIDLGKVELCGLDGKTTHCNFINIASFGLSGLTVEMVNNTTKMFGAKASFSIGTLRALRVWRDRKIRLRVDDVYDSELNVNTVAMANGRYFGGGMKIAPNAVLDDGLLDIVVVKDITPFKFIKHVGKLYRGEHLDLPFFISLRGKEVSVELLDKGPVAVETDGETPGNLPLKCVVLPKALELIAPWHGAEAI